MKIPAVDECDLDGRSFQIFRSRQSPKSTTQNDDPVFLLHALRPFKHNLVTARIISFYQSEIMKPRTHNQEPEGNIPLERDTLRLLCSVLLKPGTRLEICRLLEPGVFQDPLRRVVFEEIRSLGTIDSRRLRELLPARVTNRGFPDFDLQELLAPHQVTEPEIDRLFEGVLRLLDFSHPDEEQLAE
jgi:hypothetical protein